MKKRQTWYKQGKETKQEKQYTVKSLADKAKYSFQENKDTFYSITLFVSNTFVQNTRRLTSNILKKNRFQLRIEKSI